MKKFLLTILILFTSILSYSVEYTTIKTGTWTDNTVWDLGTYPNNIADDATLDNNDSIDVKQDITIGLLTFSNNAILYIASGYTLTVDSMSILNNAILYVEGSLVVTGGVSMANNSSLDVDLSGGIDIGGDFSGGNNVDITIDGTMDVGGDLDLGTGSTVDGTGDVYVEGDVDIPAGSDPGIVINPPLPIELLYFIIEQNNLKWATASEVNNDYFLIEYSDNTVNWNTLDIIGGASNSNSILKYSYEINDSDYYYKLTQFDFDGQSETFKIIKSHNNILNTSEYVIYNLSGQIVFVGDNYKNVLENGIYIKFNGLQSEKIAIFN